MRIGGQRRGRAAKLERVAYQRFAQRGFTDAVRAGQQYGMHRVGDKTFDLRAGGFVQN